MATFMLAWILCWLSVVSSAAPERAPPCKSNTCTAGSAWLQIKNQVSRQKTEMVSLVCPATGDGQRSGRISSRINECSGLAASRKNAGLYWTHNDSGGRARLFGIDKNGNLKKVVWVDGASAYDWEDIAVGPGPVDGQSYIYIADIGDNSKRRGSIQIYRVTEPVVDGNSWQDTKTESAQRFEIKYPDGAHDCEAVFVDQGPAAEAQGTAGRVFIITKHYGYRGDVYWVDLPSAPSHTLTFTKAGFLNHEGNGWPGAVTAADIIPQGNLIAVRAYEQLIMYPRPDGTSVEEALQGRGCHVNRKSEKQGESIAFGSDGSHYITVSEGIRVPVWHFPIQSVGGVEVTTTTTTTRTTTSATCSGVVLTDVKKQCPLAEGFGCKVLADNMQRKTCHEYCSGQGLECVNGWEESDDSCFAQQELGCHKAYRASYGYYTSDLLCQCQAAIATGSTTEQPATSEQPNNLDACGCVIGLEGWSSTRGRCSSASDTNAEEAALCLAKASKEGACLCAFDIDRTLTGRQGDTTRCTRNRVLSGVSDHGYDGGDATLSALSAEGLSKTFCAKCYLGIVSAGRGSGAGSAWNDYILNNIMRNELQDELAKSKPGTKQWSYGTDVKSPYVLNQGNKVKQNALEGIRLWYQSQGITIKAGDVYFFGDRTENIKPFETMGFNSKEISCNTRDKNPKWYGGSGMIGYCGAEPEEIEQVKGNILCP